MHPDEVTAYQLTLSKTATRRVEDPTSTSDQRLPNPSKTTDLLHLDSPPQVSICSSTRAHGARSAPFRSQGGEARTDLALPRCGIHEEREFPGADLGSGKRERERERERTGGVTRWCMLPWVKGEAARRKARRRAGSQTLIAMAGRLRSRIGGARAASVLGAYGRTLSARMDGGGRAGTSRRSTSSSSRPRELHEVHAVGSRRRQPLAFGLGSDFPSPRVCLAHSNTDRYPCCKV
jgi:hypothetical protein